jgi:hypothetical protein
MPSSWKNSRTPRYFRNRAKQYLAKAHNLLDQDARASMIRLAEHYEQLAVEAEARPPVNNKGPSLEQ